MYNYSFTNPVDDQFSSYPYSQIDFSSPKPPSLFQNSNELDSQSQKPQQNFADFYKQISQQDNPAQSAYMNFLKQGYPNQDNYKPTKMTRLAAALAGAAVGYHNPKEGIDTAQGIMNRPYERAVRQYGMEGQRLKEGATVEEGIFGKRIQAAKFLNDAREKEITDARLEKTAKSQEDLRNSQMDTAKLTRQKLVIDLKTIGYEKEVNHVTGHTEMVNKSNSDDRIDLGKFDETPLEKSERATNQAVNTAKGTSSIIQGRELAVESQRNRNARNRQSDLFTHQDTSRKDTQKFQTEQQGKTQQAITDRMRERESKRPENINAANAKNATVISSMVKRDPDRYGKLITPNAQGQLTLIDNPGATDLRKYQAWSELFNALYSGIVSPVPPAVR